MNPSGMEVRPLATALGAEIRGVDVAEGGEAVRAALYRALLDHAVIAIRDQAHLTPQQFLAFAESFGEVIDYPFSANVEGIGKLTEILKRPEETQNFGSGWHMDMSFRERQPLATILLARDMPPVGGDTMFASLKYAWQTLSPRLREILGELSAVHESWPPDTSLFKGMSFHDVEKPREVAEHPLAGRHPETGEAFLWVSPYYAREVKGLAPEESAALLGFLNAHATRPEMTCRLRWEVGTIVIWDNRWTIHQALDDDFGARIHGKGFSRLMHRAVVRQS